MNKNKGFSLVEIMVALGIMGVGMVAFMKFQANQAKTHKTMRNSVSLDSFTSDVKAYLGKPGMCNKTLINRELSNGYELRQIKGLGDNIKYEVGQRVEDSSFKIKEMKIADLAYESDGNGRLRGEAFLEIVFEKTNAGTSFGSKEMTKLIELDLLLTEDRRVVECSTLGNLVLPTILTSGAEESTDEQEGAGEAVEEVAQESQESAVSEAQENQQQTQNTNENSTDQMNEAFANSVQDAMKATGKKIDQQDINRAIKNNPQLMETLKSLKNLQKQQEEMNKMLEDM